MFYFEWGISNVPCLCFDITVHELCSVYQIGFYEGKKNSIIFSNHCAKEEIPINWAARPTF